MKKLTTLIITLICIFLSFQNYIFAEDKMVFDFESVSNSNVTSGNALVSACLHGNTALTSGISGNGLYFDGINSYAEIKKENGLSSIGAMSFSLWVKPKTDSNSGTMPLLDCEDRFKLQIDNETKEIRLFLMTTSICEMRSQYKIENEKWHYIAVTYEENKVNLYINGKLDSSKHASGSLASSEASIYVGTDGTSYYRGCIDEISFCDKALAAEEISLAYHNVMDKVTDWNYVAYPLKSLYQYGISSADASLFKNSTVYKPINTGFEEKNEINAISTDNKNGQLAVTEEKYTGKFALKIHKTGTDILPIKETEYFKTFDVSSISNIGISENADIHIAQEGQMVTVSGLRAPHEMISIYVQKGDGVRYINQTTADLFGYFGFRFLLSEYGDYEVCIGGSKSPVTRTRFTFLKTENVVPPAVEKEQVSVKCNFYNVMLKPMYQSETISFFVKCKGTDENGNQIEEYALIKSDGDGDGIFKVGEDLSRGKWQAIKLSLLDTDYKFQNGTASGLYIKANDGSEWLIDDIDSGYNKIMQNEIGLSQFSKNNVTYINESLRFVTVDNGDTPSFDTNEVVITGGVDVSKKISEVSFETDVDYAITEMPEQEEEKDVLIYEPFSSSAWSVNDVDFDLSETGVSKKTQKINLREQGPVLPNATTTTISINQETEKRFRLKIGAGIVTGASVQITDSNGISKIYPLSKTQFTDWYDGDITLKTINYSGGLCNALKVYSVEYESLGDVTEQEILMKHNGIATLDLQGRETTERGKLVLRVQDNRTAGTGLLQVELIENEACYYKSYIQATLGTDVTELSHIIPKIKPNTTIKITNLLEESSGNGADEIRLIDFKIQALAEKDWNKEKENRYNIYEKRYFLKSFTDESARGTFQFKWADDVYDENNKYAVVHQNSGGVANTANTSQTFTLPNGKAVLRIINLSKNPVYIDNGFNERIYLQYGECDYVCERHSYVQVSPDPDVIVVSAAYLNTETNKNNLTYTVVDGMNSVYDVTKDGNKVFYANVLEKNALYAYNFGLKKYQKLRDAEAEEITVNDDGTYLVVRENGKYLLIETETGKTTELPSELSENCAFYFSPKNELFVLKTYPDPNDNSYYRQAFYLYRDNQLIDLLQNEKYNYFSGNVKRSVTFDKAGEHMLVSHGSTFFKKVNGVWNKVEAFSSGGEFLSSDATMIYASTSVVDVNTKTVKNLPSGYTNVYVTSDDKLVLTKDGYYYLYDPITEEKSKVLDHADTNLLDVAFYPESNLFMARVSNYAFVRRYCTDEKPELKYALSFDGKNNWYTYTGGRWKLLSKNGEPTVEEMKSAGMTEEEVHSIPSSAYEKLYEDGSDVLTVDVAIYMNASSNNQTPVIKRITVNTQDDEGLNGLYGIHLEKYDKSDYRTVSSLFPIENFSGDAECYYLLYLGNEWLYTYKDNKLVKVVESADELLADIDTSWITFKQYGMTAKELRGIPSAVINDLFVNENYANTEFGVIYVVKTDDDDTSGYTVSFRLKSESSFIAEDDVVIEVVMNGGEIKVIDSQEFSKTDIENFLSWIEARQNGTGDIFYRIKNEKVQYFINYYMINGINVYNGTEYRESHSQQNAAQ